MITFFLRKCFIVLCIGLILPAFSLFAQEHYSLQRTIDAALRNLPILKQKQALVNASKASFKEVKHSFLPLLKASEQLNIGSDNSLAGSFFTFGITPSTSAGVRAENNLQPVTGNVAVLYSEYELMNFGLNNAKLKTVQAYVDLQESDLQKEQYLVQLEVARLYFNLLKNQYQLNADKQNIERYQHIFDIIQALAASGLKPGADSSLARAELSKSHITYNQNLGRINQLKEQMSYLTGIDEKLFLPYTLTNSKLILPDFSMDTLNNPLINFYVRKKNIFLNNENLIKKSYLPKIILASSVWARGSSIQYNDQFKSLATGLDYQRYNYAFGVALSYNLFNSIYKKDKLNTNRFQIQASDFELMQQKLALQSSASQASNALETAEINLTELPVQLHSAEAVYNQKLAQYNAGLISLIDLTNASFVLYRSQTDYAETINDWYLAQLDKAAATGNLNLFIQTVK